MKKIICLFLLICSQCIFSLTNAQYYPHPDSIDYREDFRGQYHFSPKSGWMNDINGLVYQGGKYHMLYQWGKKVRHGGYAVSSDLLHWEDKGVALIPQHSFLPPEAKRNVTGDQVYSGSAVVVSGKTAQRITGSEKEAIVAIYTGTGQGTCLAWSNDNGQTWNDYVHNPVGNYTKGADPRDPCVFWHEPTSKWILALYEKGTSFYGSQDLINWTYLSHTNFGFECPDMYQLPLDGDKNHQKWVLQDANGSYQVGEFDGVAFTRDEGQRTFVMDVGPDFYAAQTFPAGNLPDHDPRIIQIAWMDHWNGGVGEKTWERNATFPVSLGLVTYKGQKRITRNPIDEISSLYKNTQTWNDLHIEKGSNLFENIHSKTFDLSLELDPSHSDALVFGIRIANRILVYDLYNKTLEGKELMPDDSGLVRIRLLADWGQLEIFGNEGVFSYTQQFGFSPQNDDIELFTDGSVRLNRIEFHEISRTW